MSKNAGLRNRSLRECIQIKSENDNLKGNFLTFKMPFFPDFTSFLKIFYLLSKTNPYSTVKCKYQKYPHMSNKEGWFNTSYNKKEKTYSEKGKCSLKVLGINI